MTITMKEVREEIDLIDKELVLLLARRQKCIEMAALVKNDENLIIDKDRIEDVIAKVTGFGESCGLSKAISEPLWRKLIELSIEHEFQELDLIKSSN
jgi:isochorismate pyruvate lyase|tara:strand:- start:1110 stop:1400 length:291 start_codon:yes stop_codon:yes gene_type:complete